MKKHLIYMIVATALATSCNDSDNSITKTSASDTVTTTKTGNSYGSLIASTYMDLRTNQPVNAMLDSTTHTYVDMNTRQPLTYYYDPISRDTFDSRGRIVNNALILTNGDYSLDESRIQSNDDKFKMKNGETKIKMDDNSSKMKDDDIKLKERGDSYKEKTDSTKLKIKEGEIKAKEK